MQAEAGDEEQGEPGGAAERRAHPCTAAAAGKASGPAGAARSLPAWPSNYRLGAV